MQASKMQIKEKLFNLKVLKRRTGGGHKNVQEFGPLISF